jgi:superfamily II DNA/RNA helicase
MLFSELDLKPGILKALDEMGYKELTPIQEKTFGSTIPQPRISFADATPKRKQKL